MTMRVKSLYFDLKYVFHFFLEYNSYTYIHHALVCAVILDIILNLCQYINWSYALYTDSYIVPCRRRPQDSWSHREPIRGKTTKTIKIRLKKNQAIYVYQLCTQSNIWLCNVRLYDLYPFSNLAFYFCNLTNIIS